MTVMTQSDQNDSSEPDETDFVIGWMNLVRTNNKSQVNVGRISGSALDTYNSSPKFSFSDMPKCEVKLPSRGAKGYEPSKILDLRQKDDVSIWVIENDIEVTQKPWLKKYVAVLDRVHNWKSRKVRHLCAYLFSDHANLRAPATKADCVDLIARWMCDGL